jgi:uncharacterized protein
MNMHAAGTFCWVELATPDCQGAKRFYERTLNWQADDAPMAAGTDYTLLKVAGEEVAALYAIPPELRSLGIPPCWLSYVSVVSADDAAAKVAPLQGTIVLPPNDVSDLGRMALVTDPSGAALALWEARTHIGARRLGEPGALTWTELLTHDAAGTRRFYEELFDWTSEHSAADVVPYTIFKNNDGPVAGMEPMPAAWGYVPSFWNVYFAVDNCDTTVERAVQSGGTVLVSPLDSAFGRVAMLQDPQMALFSVVQF